MSNKHDARYVLEAHRQGQNVFNVRATTYHANVRKAYKILAGDLTALRGPKVTAFRDCILHPYTRAVCVDFHGVNIAEGVRRTMTETKKAVHQVKGNRYRLIAQAFRLVARRYRMRPYMAQAIAWVTWRRMNGKANQLDLQLTRD